MIFWLLSIWLGILAVVDLRWKKVPVWMLAAGGMLVTIVSFIGHENARLAGMGWLWGLMPGALFLLLWAVTKKAGLADGLVLLVMGLTLDFSECIVSFILSLFVMSAVSLFLLAGHRVRKDTKLPYLPFLWMGYVLQATIRL